MEANDWLEITTLCERFHVLPNPGGVFQQNEGDIRKLVATLNLLEEWRKEEMDNEAKK